MVSHFIEQWKYVEKLAHTFGSDVLSWTDQHVPAKSSYSTITELPSDPWFGDCFTAAADLSSSCSWTLVNHSLKRILIIALDPNLPKLSAYVSANNYSSKLNPFVDDGWVCDKSKTYSKHIYSTQHVAQCFVESMIVEFSALDKFLFNRGSLILMLSSA